MGHAIGNEVVYSLDALKSALNLFPLVTKGYLQGNVWIECHLTLAAQRHRHYLVFFKFSEGGNGRVGVGEKPEILGDAVDWDSSMFIDIAKLVEPPEQTASNCCGIRSMIWLKSFDDRDCLCGHSGRLMLESMPSILVEDVKDRELGSLGILRGQLSQGPNQLI